ncbi:MAG: hypothetical protein JZU65_20555 [Chlorobium sp.]|nr:hypothetical protein [Chlorobium sp.]
MMKPPCKLIGQNGNVFNLIAIVRKTMKAHGLKQELEQFHLDLKEIQETGGSYDDVLNLFSRYVKPE